MSVYPFRKKPMISFEHVRSSDRELQQSLVVLVVVPLLVACNRVARSKLVRLSATGKSLADVAEFGIRKAMVRSTKMPVLMAMMELVDCVRWRWSEMDGSLC